MSIKLPWSMYRELWTSYPPAPSGDYLRNKVVVITGATSGIGLEAIKQLSEASPSQIILAVRSVENGEKVLAEIQRKHPNINGKVLFLDLTDLNSVKTFSKQLIEEYDRIDVLINNAGVTPIFGEGPYKSTSDGYERTFQTNVLSPMLTTFLLTPLLKKSKDPKVLFTGSDGHAFISTDFIQRSIEYQESIIRNYNDEKRYLNETRYFETKLLLQMLTRALINHLPNISIMNVNPGLAITNIARENKFDLSFSSMYMGLWFMLNARSSKVAARNLTSACVWSGGSQDYWSSCVPTPSECTYLYSGNGVKAIKILFDEMMQELEKVSPGCTDSIGQ